jgi:hypothetical protein
MDVGIKIYVMECYSAIMKNENMICREIDGTIIILREISQTQKNKYPIFSLMYMESYNDLKAGVLLCKKRGTAAAWIREGNR